MATAQIKPGSKVRMTIVKRPTNAAATKTLVRLLNKDPQAQREEKLLTKVRERGAKPRQRGGRIWTHKMTKQHRRQGQPGEAATITASVDVLRDLASVDRFVEVQQA